MVAGGLDRKNAGLDAARKIRSSEIRMIGSRIAALTTRVIMMSIECVQLNNRRPRTPSWAKNHHVDTVYSVAAETMVGAMRTLLRRMVNFCIGRRTCRPEEERVGLRLRLSWNTRGRVACHVAATLRALSASGPPFRELSRCVAQRRCPPWCPRCCHDGAGAVQTRHEDPRGGWCARLRTTSIPLDIDDGSRPCMYEDLP